MGRKNTSKHDEQDRELLTHINSLGLRTVEDYRRWCAANGFSCRLKKDWKQRCRERSKLKAAVIEQRIVRKKQEQRNPVGLLTDICQLRLQEDDLTQPKLKRLCQVIQSQRATRDSPANLQALLQLLLHFHACRTDFIATDPVIAEFGRRAGNSCVEAVVLLAAYHQAWLRPVEAWKPRTHNTRRQFASLLRHLFVRYDDMPVFFDSVWFAGPTANGTERRAAYLHVGCGGSVRSCDLPIPVTKRMAHYFKQAPSDLTFEKAVRWGQILAFGGDDRLARAILGTRLGESFEHDDFWITVIEWLVFHPMLDRVHVGPLVDYLHHQRFVSDLVVAPGIQVAPPPQPNLTMKGRTPETLLRNVNQWHRRLATDNAHQVGQWKPTGFDGLEFIEGSETSRNSKTWTIRELLSTKALIAEGRQLNHCVATYSSSCLRGHCSIWTMEVETDKGRTKSLTLEVRNQQRVICQARGKANRLPTEKERGILRRWATQAGLMVASYV